MHLPREILDKMVIKHINHLKPYPLVILLGGLKNSQRLQVKKSKA
jgi:hypothetical protein